MVLAHTTHNRTDEVYVEYGPDVDQMKHNGNGQETHTAEPRHDEVICYAVRTTGQCFEL